ncbi:hypothetical protein Tco_0380989 [Tanacetum coccineum]
MMEKKSRHEPMPFPRFTKVIINHFLSQHKSFSKLKFQHYHTIKDDGVVSRLKFVRIGKDYQDYGLPIPETMLTLGKGSHGKKTPDTTEATINVSKESDTEPARKRTASRRVVKKKVTSTADDNIVPESNIALKLGKSMSLTEAAEEEATRQVHATHARIVTEPIPEPARRRPSALKESKKTSRRQPGTGGSSEGTGVSPRVPDESTVVPATSSEGEGTGTKPGVLDEEKVTSEANVDTNEEEEKKDDNDDKSIDLEQTDDEETDDEFVHVNDDEDEEMTNAEVEESGNDDEEVTDATKVDAGKNEEVKDDAKKVELPPTSSILSVSSGFSDQFLKLLFDTSLIGNVKDTIDAEINSLLDIKIQYEVPHIQSPSILTEPVSVIFEPLVLTPIPKTPSVALVTTLLPPSSVSTIPPVLLQTTTPNPAPPITTEAPTITTAILESNALAAVQLRVSKLEKDVSELKKMDHSPEAPALKPSKIQTSTINLEPKSKKRASKIRKIKKEQDEKQNMPKYIIKSTDKVTLKEYHLKSALYLTINENKSFNRNPTNHALYHALMEALIDVMDKGVSDTVKNHKIQHDDDEDDDEDPNVGPNKGKKTKRKRTKESESSMKPSTTKEISKGKAPTKSSKIEGDHCPFDVSKPLPLKGRPGHLTVVAEYFFNNDLEFLKSLDPKKKYTTSITKTKVARYEIVGIEDTKILSVVSVSVKKLHGYGHLDEIVVRRADLQHKLFQLNGSDIVDLIAALRMFTGSLIIKRRVEDLRLGVESYQKKLNITAPQKTFPEIKFKELYTPSYKPPWVIYEDLNKHKRVMRADELYKFLNGTLKTVCDELHIKILDFLLGYNKEMSRRKWTAIHKRRSELMVELIDKQIRERRIIRNLERLVGARELEMEYRLMTRTN